MAAAEYDYDDSVGGLADRTRCHVEFMRPYLGGDTLPAQLRDYITACARRITDTPSRFKIPLLSIVQSAGFGKSRLLRELALRTKDEPHGAMRVLYTNVRPHNDRRYGYPHATSHLRDFLFPGADDDTTGRRRDPCGMLTTKLLRLFDYAASHWNTVGLEWWPLLDTQRDDSIYRRLVTHGMRETLAKKDARVLVLAIDDARFLLTTHAENPMGWHQRLLHALAKVAPQIRLQYGASACLFVVLVDANPAILAGPCAPPILVPNHSESGRLASDLFAPFVLTQTMDIRFDAMAFDSDQSQKALYQQLLTSSNANATWRVFAAMGRPLWDRVKLGNVRKLEPSSDVIQHAADLLMGGWRGFSRQPFTEDTMYGVASVLCRLELSPSPWSPLASPMVADGMEPVLAFGAARVWYDDASRRDAHASLTQYIVPHFRALLCQDLVDTDGDRGRLVVGGLVLLLAIDATGVVASPAADEYFRPYAGAFYSVATFLNVLYGDTPLLVRDPQHKDVTSCFAETVETMLSDWRTWQVGFSHFVRLETQPRGDELWAMLVRRAAGVLSRSSGDDDNAVDLCIPIFQDTTVSMMLVQVETHAQGYRSPRACMESGEGAQQNPQNVVRLHLNLQGLGSESPHEPYWLVDSTAPPVPDLGGLAFVLCLDGLRAWCAQGVAVLSDALAVELQKLLKPWWNERSLVDALLHDLAQRQVPGIMTSDEIHAIASRPSVGSLLERH